MSPKDLEREIRMNCPTCGNSDFEVDETIEEEHQIVKCVNCKRKLTRSELIELNSENIEKHVEEVGELLTKEIEKQLTNSIKKLKLKF